MLRIYTQSNQKQIKSMLLLWGLLPQILGNIIHTQLNSQNLVASNTVACLEVPQVDFVLLDSNHQSIELRYETQSPHYAIALYMDLFFLEDFQGKNLELLFDDKLADSIQESLPEFRSFCTINNKRVYQKVYANNFFHHQKSLKLTLKVTDLTVGIRNVQVEELPCHQSCKFCDGPAENNCKSCYQNFVYNRAEQTCRCPQLYPFFDTQNKICTSKCGRQQILIDGKCIVENNFVELESSFFNSLSTERWSVQTGGLNLPNLESKFLHQETPEKAIFGLFDNTHTAIYNLGNQEQFFSRIRFDIYIFKISDTPKIHVAANKFNQTIKPIFQSKCNLPNLCNILQVDFNVDLPAQAQVSLSIAHDKDFKWGLREFVLDKISCSFGCIKCSGRYVCELCAQNQFLHKGQCVASCPDNMVANQNRCVNHIEGNQVQIDSGLLSESYSEFEVTGHAFKVIDRSRPYGVYYGGHRYLGGYYQNYISKVYTNLPPHYQISFIAQSFCQTILSSSSTQSWPSNLIYLAVSQGFFETFELNQNQLSQTKELKGTFSHFDDKAEINIIAPFETTVGIREFYVYLSLCYPLCRSCQGPLEADCTEWIVEQNSESVSSKSVCNDGYIFDSIHQRCMLCPIGCKKCSDTQSCLVCEQNFVQIDYGCYCIDGQVDQETWECKQSGRNLRSLEELVKKRLNHLKY